MANTYIDDKFQSISFKQFVKILKYFFNGEKPIFEGWEEGLKKKREICAQLLEEFDIYTHVTELEKALGKW